MKKTLGLLILVLTLQSQVVLSETLKIDSSTQLNYETYGDPTSVPIILIHGYPLNQTMWQGQVNALKDRAFVITYDQRGFGKSLTTDPQYTFETYVDDLTALLNHLKIKQVMVVGFSMGGYVALRSLEKSPDRFLGLVLADTQSAADSDKSKLGRGKSLVALKQSGLEKIGNDFLAVALSPRSRSDNQMTKLMNIIQQNPESGVASALIALATRTDTTESLGKIIVPTLILVGAEDTITPITAAQSLKDKISGSSLTVIPSAGHLTPIENESEFNKAFIAFFQSHVLLKSLIKFKNSSP